MQKCKIGCKGRSRPFLLKETKSRKPKKYRWQFKPVPGFKLVLIERKEQEKPTNRRVKPTGARNHWRERSREKAWKWVGLSQQISKQESNPGTIRKESERKGPWRDTVTDSHWLWHSKKGISQGEFPDEKAGKSDCLAYAASYGFRAGEGNFSEQEVPLRYFIGFIIFENCKEKYTIRLLVCLPINQDRITWKFFSPFSRFLVSVFPFWFLDSKYQKFWIFRQILIFLYQTINKKRGLGPPLLFFN